MLRHSDVVTPAQAGAQSWMAYAFVYIVTNKRYGTLYVGVPSDLVKRASQHRLAILDGFTKDHGLDRLVWYEAHDDVVAAIEREKRIKRWRRDWKVNLVQSMNPAWIDLYPSLV
jgi:putative endonuclease